MISQSVSCFDNVHVYFLFFSFCPPLSIAQIICVEEAHLTITRIVRAYSLAGPLAHTHTHAQATPCLLILSSLNNPHHAAMT